MSYLDQMVRSYAETALWSSSNELHEKDPDKHSEMLDGDFDVDDIAPETMAEMRRDCESFWKNNRDDLAEMEADQAGHDLWLTRNRHGAGFWDRGLGALGDRLTKMAKLCGGYDLYVGDDGKVHGQR